MIEYQIIATKQVPAGNRPDHARIVEVKLSTGDKHGVLTVVGNIDGTRARYWVYNPDTGSRTYVETYQDATLGRRHIRTRPTSSEKDNLDHLPTYT